ncbi:hypothetical protein LCGC14_2554700 [marine sediment metagenome]|uniref:t-SNARE coiled-coil homology domain-containing protein n=1 Tax=marine sediment metagenome TaxID=412755 RepID=A0A0F9AMD5_9ZZZZ
MGNGDPVTQHQFYEGQKEVLQAVEKVNGGVQNIRVDVGQIDTKLDNNEMRMDAQDTRMDGQDVKIDDQKKWNRGLAAIEAALAALLVAVGIRGE